MYHIGWTVPPKDCAGNWIAEVFRPLPEHEAAAVSEALDWHEGRGQEE